MARDSNTTEGKKIILVNLRIDHDNLAETTAGIKGLIGPIRVVGINKLVNYYK